ncbi:hypothetical protein [Mesorhizobium sp. M0047]|uniref:hypothetical protein n=1 Tax=Mesorhizobium sp. M0047 TaxID=2956859 RepID=UPI00333A816B
MQPDSSRTEFLRARVTERTKIDFDAICQELGKTSTEQMRELIEDFVRENYNVLTDRVVVHIYRPEGYSFGAWRVTIKLRNPADMTWSGTSVPFHLPDLPKRRLISDPEYRSVVEGADGQPTLGGVFDGPEWRGHVYSNGSEEPENPTPIVQVEKALRDTIISVIGRFSPK